MQLLPTMYDSCELQSKKKLFAEWSTEEPLESGVAFHPSRRGSPCAQPWATRRDIPQRWHYGITQDLLSASDGNTLTSLRRGKSKTDFHSWQAQEWNITWG